MTKEQIENSIKTEELQMSFLDKLTHFWIVIFLMIIPMTLLFFYAKDYSKGRLESIGTGNFFIIIVPIILSIYYYLLQKDKLKFKTIATNHNRDELDKIIKQVADNLKWNIHTNNEKVIIANTSPGFFSGSWGEQITILFDGKKVLVNSICDPNKRSSVVSMGRNGKNMNTLINHIHNTSISN